MCITAKFLKLVDVSTSKLVEMREPLIVGPTSSHQGKPDL